MLNEEEMDWDLPCNGEIASVLCGESAVADTAQCTLYGDVCADDYDF